jgi:hypothetical protein
MGRFGARFLHLLPYIRAMIDGFAVGNQGN